MIKWDAICSSCEDMYLSIMETHRDSSVWWDLSYIATSWILMKYSPVEKTLRCQSIKERSQRENLQGNSILRCHCLLRPLCKSLDIFNWIHVFKISILCLLSFQGIKYNTIQYEEKYVFNNFLTNIWLKGLNGWAWESNVLFV